MAEDHIMEVLTKGILEAMANFNIQVNTMDSSSSSRVFLMEVLH